MQRFFSELQRRKVLRVASAYVVGGMDHPAGGAGAADGDVAAGLVLDRHPRAARHRLSRSRSSLAWFFEITPEGIKRTVASGDGALVKPQTTDLILGGDAGARARRRARSGRHAARTARHRHATADVPNAKTRTARPRRQVDRRAAVREPVDGQGGRLFADGLTEEMLELLAKIGDLKVISRTSSFAFKGKDTPLPEIAKQLGVRHILEGSVRRDGDDCASPRS